MTPLLRLVYCLFCLFFLAASGCVSFHSYRPVPVLVRDAETKKPIPGAVVNIWYPTATRMSIPEESAAESGGDGIAHLKAAPYSDAGIMVGSKAQGYLPEQLNVALEIIEKIEPDHWYKKIQERPVAVVIEMMAEPRPVVELTLPTGYKGLVKVKLHLRDTVPWPAGQRTFAYPVSATGKADPEAPAALRRFYPIQYRARYADGKALDPNAAPTEITLRWLRNSAGEDLFVVGTKSDLEDMRSLTRPPAAGPRDHAGGSGGRQGGRKHGRGGNQNGGQGQTPSSSTDQ